MILILLRGHHTMSSCGQKRNESGAHRNTTMREDRDYSAVKFRELNSTDQPVLLPRYYFEAGLRLRTSNK